MAFFKRIFLFIILNVLVVFTITLLMSIFNVQPYLNAYGIDIKALAIFCLIWGFAGAFISLFLSKSMAKWMMGVKIIEEGSNDPKAEHILKTVKDLSLKAGLFKTPQVGIYESKEANAFATGATKNNSLVAVSSGLLNQMGQDEIEAIIGHEISHIKNGDMITMTLLQGVVNAFVMFLARILAFTLSSFGKERNRSSFATQRMFVILFEVIFMVLGSIIVATYSRKREFRADAGGAKLAGKDKMINALASLKKVYDIRDIKTEKPSYQTLKISTPSKKNLLRLFATHPPLDERIQRLKDYE
jgi:heat shock protein HtpX